ncbi:TNF receptor-associated factor 6 [Cylas formicarius]|uniref:TNF receptor-associated factor 6 n=1 Tax=Cylas formicarius TaxID=197179 RepID=UPI0029588D20|nr:TNF receptor-associated factor 6 [Cylas formicarius]
MDQESSYDTHKTDASLAQESSINDSFATPEARFECPICLAWLRDPVLTSCGHRFCRSCIYSWLEKEKACPVDNMKLDIAADIFPDNFTRREISQQKIKCPNIIRGCLKDLSPLDVESHLLVCEFRPPSLPESEKLQCTFVNVDCRDKFEDELELERHLEQNVPKHLTLLSQAYANMTASQNASASTSVIPQTNFWDPPSKNESTSQSLDDDRISSLLKALYEKIVMLEQKTREQDIIIANMSQQISSYNLTVTKFQQRYCNGCYIWYFNDFKTKISTMRENPGIFHYSPGFYTSAYGYKLGIRLNLSPKDVNYLAIIVHFMKSEHDNALDWPFCGRLSIEIVHPTQSFRNIKETMMTRPELAAFNRPVQDMNPKGFGYTEFVLVEELFEQDFIVNNQLIIKVRAQAV